MKDRMTLGYLTDVAESAALTLADKEAENRMVNAIDWEHDCKVRGGIISAALKKLTPSQRRLAKQILNGKSWAEIGMNKRTFNRVLKNILNQLQPQK